MFLILNRYLFGGGSKWLNVNYEIDYIKTNQTKPDQTQGFDSIICVGTFTSFNFNSFN